MEDSIFNLGVIVWVVKISLRDITSNLRKFQNMGIHDPLVMQELTCPIVPVCAKMPRLIVWTLPEVGRLKLNVDGGSCGNPGLSGGGGIIRDSQGIVIATFAHFYSQATNTIIECRALLDGLRLCHSLGLRDLLVEFDSSVVIS